MTLRSALLSLCLFGCALGAAAQDYPALSGRVVDQAGILSAATEQALTAKLEAHEQATGAQIVVATIADLQGYEIADYGVGLGRFWGIGAEDRDDGALLIVAPNDRRVRIEVGYGLEGVLTDAASKTIIDRVIVPSFRAGDMEAGVAAGVDAIIAIVSGEEFAPAPPSRSKDGGPLPLLMFLLFAGFWVFSVVRGLTQRDHNSRRRSHSRRWGVGPVGGGGFGGGSFGGGGFSGGGGSFGGGGASGGW